MRYNLQGSNASPFVWPSRGTNDYNLHDQFGFHDMALLRALSLMRSDVLLGPQVEEEMKGLGITDL